MNATTTITEKEQNRINRFLTITDNMNDYEVGGEDYQRLFQTARLAYYNLTIEGQEIAYNRYFETFGKNWR